MKMPYAIENYFHSWKNYDVSLLADIFAANAVYIIQPNNQTLSGVNAIQQYWLRNARRQRNLVISWQLIDWLAQDYICTFEAQFDDIEERETHRIAGHINFTLNNNGCIVVLSETYSKEVLRTLSLSVSKSVL
jgi:hypothetical protein